MRQSIGLSGLRRYLPVVLGAAILLSATGCGDNTPSCSSLARSTYSGDNRFVDVTFTKDHFVKGIVGDYVHGDKRTVGHWECSTESGEPVITFYSPAG